MKENKYSSAGLYADMNWLTELLAERMSCTGPEYPPLDLSRNAPPVLSGNCFYSSMLREYSLNTEQRIILALALAPHIQPDILDPLILNDSVVFPTYSMIGGRKGIVHNGFLPTIQTALFLIAGHDPDRKHEVMDNFEPGGKLFTSRLVVTETENGFEPLTSAMITIESGMLQFLLTGKYNVPHFSSEFPVKVAATDLKWNRLVVHKTTEKSLEAVLHQMQNRSKGNFAVFSGESGTGKTLAATLLGDRIKRPVFITECLMLMSAHITETERKLENILRSAEESDAILMFRKCDILFRKESANHDRSAMREGTFLLERLAETTVPVIFSVSDVRLLSTDFIRVQKNLVQFPMPEIAQRLRLWKEAIPGGIEIDSEIDLMKFAECFMISGATICNAVRSAIATMQMRESNTLKIEDFQWGLQVEYQKLNRKLDSQDLFKKPLSYNNSH